MITLKDISTYDLRKIQSPLIQEQFDLFGIKDYQALAEALYNGLIDEDITMIGFLSVARDIAKTGDDIIIPTLASEHKGSIDYQVNGIDIGITNVSLAPLTMNSILHLYTHVDLNGKSSLSNYPGVEKEELAGIIKKIKSYDEKIYPSLTSKNKVLTKNR